MTRKLIDLEGNFNLSAARARAGDRNGLLVPLSFSLSLSSSLFFLKLICKSCNIDRHFSCPPGDSEASGSAWDDNNVVMQLSVCQTVHYTPDTPITHTHYCIVPSLSKPTILRFFTSIVLVTAEDYEIDVRNLCHAVIEKSPRSPRSWLFSYNGVAQSGEKLSYITICQQFIFIHRSNSNAPYFSTHLYLYIMPRNVCKSRLSRSRETAKKRKQLCPEDVCLTLNVSINESWTSP